MSAMADRQANCPPELRNVVHFLRNKSGMKLKTGVLSGKRVDYFKGKAAIKALTSPEYAKLKNVPSVANDNEAIAVMNKIFPFTFFLLVDRGNSIPPPPSAASQKKAKLLTVAQQQSFFAKGYYAWFYEGSQLKLALAGFGMVALVLAGVMFPLWPTSMRIGAWYLSIGMLGLIGAFFGIAILRLIFYVITLVVAKPGIWIFPKLFDDVGFVESFIPFWAWDLPPPKTKKKKSKSSKSGEEGGSKSEKKKSLKKRQSSSITAENSSSNENNNNKNSNEPKQTES